MYGKTELEKFTGLSQMPQEAASAWGVVSKLDGATYKPLLYCGSQVVKGVNYWFIAEQSFSIAAPERRIVKLAINKFNNAYEPVKDSIEVIIG